MMPFLPHAPRDPGFFVDPKPDAKDTLNKFEWWWRYPAQVALFLFGLVNAGVPMGAWSSAHGDCRLPSSSANRSACSSVRRRSARWLAPAEARALARAGRGGISRRARLHRGAVLLRRDGAARSAAVGVKHGCDRQPRGRPDRAADGAAARRRAVRAARARTERAAAACWMRFTPRTKTRGAVKRRLRNHCAVTPHSSAPARSRVSISSRRR